MFFNSQPAEIDDDMRPIVPTMFEIPPNYILRYEADVDTISFIAQDFPSLAMFFSDEKSVWHYVTKISRTHSDKNSKLRVVRSDPESNERFGVSYVGASVNSLPLNLFPNIHIGHVVQSNLSFHIHLYLCGDGAARKTNYFTNTELQTLVIAMNYASRYVRLAFSNNRENSVKRIRYTEECSGLSFVAHDGSKEMNQIRNSSKMMSGGTGKSFLSAIWVALGHIVQIGESPPESDAMDDINNEFTLLFGPRSTSPMEVESLVATAKHFLENSVVVAECAGTKYVFCEKLVASFRREQNEELESWINGAIGELNDSVINEFLRDTIYPVTAFHRVDFAIQVFPSSFDFALCVRLDDARKYVTSALKVVRESQEEYIHAQSQAFGK